jgi:hypothetical protein
MAAPCPSLKWPGDTAELYIHIMDGGAPMIENRKRNAAPTNLALDSPIVEPVKRLPQVKTIRARSASPEHYVRSPSCSAVPAFGATAGCFEWNDPKAARSRVSAPHEGREGSRE